MTYEEFKAEEKRISEETMKILADPSRCDFQEAYSKGILDIHNLRNKYADEVKKQGHVGGITMEDAKRALGL